MGMVLSLVIDNRCTTCDGIGSYPSYRGCYECHGTGYYYSIKRSILEAIDKTTTISFIKN